MPNWPMRSAAGSADTLSSFTLPVPAAKGSRHPRGPAVTRPGENYGRMWEGGVPPAAPLRPRAARKERDAKPGARLRIADGGLREGILIQMMRRDGVWHPGAPRGAPPSPGDRSP